MFALLITNYFTRHPYPKDIYWLVEISNRTLKLDLEKKAAIYARNGVAEYWIIDLINKKLIVHIQPTNNGYARIETMETGTIFPQAFPNLAIALNRMLLF